MTVSLGYEYRLAHPEDLAGIARVFAAAFPESMQHYFPGRKPGLTVVSEPFSLCLASEPEAFFVADAGHGEIAGYIFAPAETGRLKRVALRQGFLWRWAWRWLTGRYGIGLSPVQALSANKLAFLTSAREDPKLQTEARILSVAVHPEHQGRGIAKNLCAMGIARLDRCRAWPVRLEVRPWNVPAVKVYTGLGFEVVGETKDAQGEWLIMLRRGAAAAAAASLLPPE